MSLHDSLAEVNYGSDKEQNARRLLEDLERYCREDKHDNEFDKLVRSKAETYLSSRSDAGYDAMVRNAEAYGSASPLGELRIEDGEIVAYTFTEKEYLARIKHITFVLEEFHCLAPDKRSPKVTKAFRKLEQMLRTHFSRSVLDIPKIKG